MTTIIEKLDKIVELTKEINDMLVGSEDETLIDCYRCDIPVPDDLISSSGYCENCHSDMFDKWK